MLGCYDGDTCKIKFDNTPEILAEQTQDFDPDTPELKGKCEKEKMMAKTAKMITFDYMKKEGKIYATGERGKYGRLL